MCTWRDAAAVWRGAQGGVACGARRGVQRGVAGGVRRGAVAAACCTRAWFGVEPKPQWQDLLHRSEPMC